MKVIIIGAGIAGLTLANACERLGIEVKLYEKTKRLQNIGGGILIWPHGLRYLEWLGVAKCLEPFWVPVVGCNIVGHQGNEIFSEAYAHLHELIGGRILPIDRSQFQQALVTQLSKGILNLNKQCVRIESNQTNAKVFFADGSEDSADLIVGADGINSIVRKNFNPIEKQYTNYCWWGGIIEQKDLPELAADRVFVVMGVGKICMIWPTSDNRFMWYLPVKMNLEHFDAINSQKQLHVITKDWNPIVTKLINAPQVTQSFQLPIYVVPPQEHCINNRTVLIGDAAHALGPILGQGASQAIEDAFILTKCIENTGSDDIAKMLCEYETLRYQKYLHIARLENQTAEVMICEDVETLSAFEAQAAELDLATMYKELIPLINERFCLALAERLREIKLEIA